MDPRHPELVLPRVKELVKQIEEVEKNIKSTRVANELATLERKGVLLVQELCLVAPRLHEAFIQDSRNRRQELARMPEPIHSEAGVDEEPKAEPEKKVKVTKKKAKK